jgi:hypothetical protein
MERGAGRTTGTGSWSSEQRGSLDAFLIVESVATGIVRFSSRKS